MLFIFLDSCELYTGDLCANLDDYKETTVLVRRDRAHQSQANIEEVVSNYFNFYFRLQRVTEGCKNILRMLLCYRAFPKCTESSTELLCSEYCRFNQTLKYLCPSMFETLAQFVLYNGQFLSSPSCHLVESIDSQCVDIPQMSELFEYIEKQVFFKAWLMIITSICILIEIVIVNCMSYTLCPIQCFILYDFF